MKADPVAVGRPKRNLGILSAGQHVGSGLVKPPYPERRSSPHRAGDEYDRAAVGREGQLRRRDGGVRNTSEDGFLRREDGETRDITSGRGAPGPDREEQGDT